MREFGWHLAHLAMPLQNTEQGRKAWDPRGGKHE